MGYLQYDPGPANFSKAVFSFWFRIPSATIAAAIAQFTAADVPDGVDNGGTYDSNLLGKIPLVTWGANPTASVTGLAPWSTQTSPCFIGVNCGQRVISNSGIVDPPTLVIFLAYSGQDETFTLNSGFPNESHWTIPLNYKVGFWGGHAEFWEGNVHSSYADDNHITYPRYVTVSADSWHHVLVSFDLSHATSGSADGGTGYSTFGATNKLWMAFDDTNYDTGYLWPSSAATAGAGNGPNDIVPDTNNNNNSNTLHSATNGALQSSSHKFGIPCHGDNSDFVYNVEMAEFQMFTGVTLDTSVVANRRLFVSDVGRPVAGTVAADALGVAPVIKLHGQANWMSGINSGSIGSAMTPFGTITSFTPGP